MGRKGSNALRKKSKSSRKASLRLQASIADHFTIEEKNKLILENREQGQKIACSILRKWDCRLELEEVESLVDLSLCEAVKNYDPNKGASFITFLYYHLRGNLIRTINTRATRSPLPLEFTDENLESGFIGKERINQAEIAEVMGSERATQPDALCEHRQLCKIAEEACDKLSELEKEIIFNIYLQEAQVTKLAKDLKYSRCHISRLKTSAIKKLRSEVTRITGEEIDIEESLAA